MTQFHGISSTDDCKIISLEQNHHPNGNLTVVQDNCELPFKINRVYYLYDVPSGAERGGHSHKECYEFLVAASGAFDVIVDDGKQTKRFTLKSPHQGLLIVPGIWRTLENFSSGSVCLVIASHRYDEADYIREYNDFIAETQK